MRRFEVGENPAIESLSQVEFRCPEPERDEIRVRVEASSLNFHDYLVATGTIKVAPGRVPLSDGVGVVEACGCDVRRFAPGDRVMGTFFADWFDGGPQAQRVARMRGDHVDGFAATHVVMSEAGFTRVPDKLTPVEAATLPCAGLTAWRAVFVEGQVRPGDTVLVQGSGGVSVFALQFARMAGAQVIATTSSSAKAERLKALGASHVIDYGADEKWGRTAHGLAGAGVDLVVEVAGGDLSQSFQALRVGGRLCLVGVLTRQPIQFPAFHMIHANRQVGGITVGSRQHQEDMVRAIEINGLQPVIDTTYRLDDLPDAFRRMEEQRHFGKIAIGIKP